MRFSGILGLRSLGVANRRFSGILGLRSLRVANRRFSGILGLRSLRVANRWFSGILGLRSLGVTNMRFSGVLNLQSLEVMNMRKSGISNRQSHELRKSRTENSRTSEKQSQSCRPKKSGFRVWTSGRLVNVWGEKDILVCVHIRNILRARGCFRNVKSLRLPIKGGVRARVNSFITVESLSILWEILSLLSHRYHAWTCYCSFSLACSGNLSELSDTPQQSLIVTADHHRYNET
jgi:hypothetical protein